MISSKYGGGEHYLVELAKLCNKKDYHTVVQYESPPKNPEYIADLAKIGVEIAICPIGNTEVARVSRPIASKPIKSILNLIKLIRSVKPDIVHISFASMYILFTLPIISKMLGIKKIIYVVQCYPGLRQKSLVRLIYNQYDHIVAVSESIAHNLIQAGINPNIVSIHIIGIFGEREKSNQLRLDLRKEFKIPYQAVALGCIAFDRPVKGLDILLKAFSKVIEKKSEVHLIIIGVDPKISSLPKLAEKLGLINNVHWAGIRDNAWQILNAVDMYVQPSLSEGMPIAIMEATALKLPVVATNAGGVPEIVKNGENGYLAKPGCVESLVDALERMLAEPSQWEIMGELGYRRYQDLFIGEKSVKEFVEKYYSTE
jgi:glycosyltransferase involved in cell wall biosynthesis